MGLGDQCYAYLFIQTSQPSILKSPLESKSCRVTKLPEPAFNSTPVGEFFSLYEKQQTDSMLAFLWKMQTHRLQGKEAMFSLLQKNHLRSCGTGKTNIWDLFKCKMSTIYRHCIFNLKNVYFLPFFIATRLLSKT